MARDVVAEIIAYNLPLVADDRRIKSEGGRDLTREALGRKLAALAKSPFSFFRGTFHLMALDVLRARVPESERRAPDALIVGDLHLENFGVYRGASGKLVFDVNDFDDVGMGPADFDLLRLCTSAFLLTDVPLASRTAAAEALAGGWQEGVQRIGGRFPVRSFDDAKADEPVRSLLEQHRGRTQLEQLLKATEDRGHRRFAELGEQPRYARLGKATEAMVRRALAESLVALEQLRVDVSSTWEVLDVAYRFKGNGSLGRQRFAALLGRGDARRLLELKEARNSCLDDALERPCSPQRARAQTASIRRLQGSPWPRVASTHLGPLPALVREVQAEEEKLSTGVFAPGGQGKPALVAYARQCGDVTARLLCRASAPLVLDDASFDPAACARRAIAFSRAYARQVESDHEAFVKGRATVARALGLP